LFEVFFFLKEGYHGKVFFSNQSVWHRSMQRKLG
jgi:hypothetical protein